VVHLDASKVAVSIAKENMAAINRTSNQRLDASDGSATRGSRRPVVNKVSGQEDDYKSRSAIFGNGTMVRSTSEEQFPQAGLFNSLNAGGKQSLATVRFIVDDCLTFLEREVNRGRKYQALIFDPPAFGRGKGNRIWSLDEDLPKLMAFIPKLLCDKSPCFVLITCHDENWSSKKLAELLSQSTISTGLEGVVEHGELRLAPPTKAEVENILAIEKTEGPGQGGDGVRERKEPPRPARKTRVPVLGGKALPCGVYARWIRKTSATPSQI